MLWSGWAWNQTRGWQGELFLEPGVTTRLGVDGTPVVTFSHFLIPPAPDGAGRVLALTLLVDGQRHDIAEATPYRGAGWALVPRWYGATVQGEALPAPLFFGASGTQRTILRDGRAITVTLNVDSLRLSTEPAIDGLSATHHAILRARFAPGAPLKGAGMALMGLGLLLSLWKRGYTATLFEQRNGQKV
ncbi:MAG: hypothetical protein H0T73_14730 [Ardenticatenales bacterium]|nr:hypothetical protein [Ardenticatenales bacterium]